MFKLDQQALRNPLGRCDEHLDRRPGWRGWMDEGFGVRRSRRAGVVKSRIQLDLVFGVAEKVVI
mgnify:CR=1 FL=1